MHPTAKKSSSEVTFETDQLFQVFNGGRTVLKLYFEKKNWLAVYTFFCKSM
jgi:hypothetical protein